MTECPILRYFGAHIGIRRLTDPVPLRAEGHEMPTMPNIFQRANP
jgi:hypothetical protein